MASTGGGIALSGDTRAWIDHSILAYNAGLQFYVDPDDRAGTPSPRISYCDLYSPDGASHNISSLAAGNLTLEPGFLVRDELGAPLDFHLAWLKLEPLRKHTFGGSPREGLHLLGRFLPVRAT